MLRYPEERRSILAPRFERSHHLNWVLSPFCPLLSYAKRHAMPLVAFGPRGEGVPKSLYILPFFFTSFPFAQVLACSDRGVVQKKAKRQLLMQWFFAQSISSFARGMCSLSFLLFASIVCFLWWNMVERWGFKFLPPFAHVPPPFLGQFLAAILSAI